MKHSFLATLVILFSVTTVKAQEFPDRHNTTLENSWISCTMTPNPNPDKGNSHWIMYDFGTTYALNKSTFWNVNAYEHTDEGLNDIEIDYSLDGVTWKNWGRYSLDQASGLSTYEGTSGPNFNGLVARYFLITANSNHGGTCYGLSEFRVESTGVTISDLSDLELDIDVQASPNPFNERSKITLSKKLEDGSFYQLIDMSGRVVRQNIIQGKEFFIEGSGLSSGVYNVAINSGNRIKTIQINLTK